VRDHLTPANLVTSVSLTLGFLALVVAPSELGLAALLVVLAGVLDGVDGVLARRAGGDHTFGAQLDSLTDLLCFCVVPAYTTYQVVDDGLQVPGLLSSCLFLLAGAWRLARFPLVQRQGSFVGLPTPAAGALLMLLALLAPPVAVLLGAVLLSALMISTLRCPSVLAAAASVRPRRPDLPGRRLRAAARRSSPRRCLALGCAAAPGRDGSDASAPAAPCAPWPTAGCVAVAADRLRASGYPVGGWV